MSAWLVDHGPVSCSMESIIVAVRSIPLDAWVYRSDPESYETRVVGENSVDFPVLEATELMDCAMEEYLEPGFFNRLVLSCVPAGKGIRPHTDDFGEAVRSRSRHCHIPIITDESCLMGFPNRGETVHLRAGHLYTLDETERHCVENGSQADRVHLLFAHWPHKA